MKLPNHEQAIIAEAKILKYLIDDTHPRGKDKAIFFMSFGFSRAEWQKLSIALLKHAANHEVTSTLTTTEGVHYVIEGELLTPDERNPQLRSIWAIDKGDEIPRFITAYPMKKKDDSDD